MPRIFVVHKHHARNLHYDLRLEVDGVLKSWAVPKGPSLQKGVKRLAVAVPDHAYSYKDFEGVLPEGSYGAGQVLIWDNGIYTTETDPAEQLENGKLEIVFEGKKLSGPYVLLQTREPKNWLLIKL